MAHDYDVIIIGGGPAGSLCAAIALRQNPGRRALVLERERFPRHHVGEVSLPGWAAVIRRAGALEKVDAKIPLKKIGVVFNWGPPEVGEVWTADFREEKFGRPAPGSWHLDRSAFDHALLDHAADLGAEVRQEATVTAVRALPDLAGPPREGDRVEGVEVTWTERGETRRATAGHVVDATGQARFLARHWQLPLRRHADMNNYAVYGYWTGSAIQSSEPPPRENERWAVIAWCAYGWVWHIPILPDVVSVGLVTNKDTIRAAGKGELRTLYDEAIASAPTVARLLAPAKLVGGLPDGTSPRELSVVQDWAYYSERSCGPGWFQVGDTAMFVDPILSSGLTLAAQGSLMVANALTTIWNERDVDEPLLRESLDRRYRAIGDVYHRMARVWYRQNIRGATWHWHALKERLRATGEAIYERSSDAFTAIVLGAVNDPLENAVRASAESRHGTEFFTWLSSRRLFEPDGSSRWARVVDADSARAEARRSLIERWGKLARSRVRLKSGAPRLREGYHTSDEIDRWRKLRYVEVEVPAPGDEPLRLAFPAFDDSGGLLARLDGGVFTDEALRAELGTLPVGGDERSRRAVAMVEMLVQLDMLELLEVVETRARAPLKGHPLLTVLVEAALVTAGSPCAVTAELDWLGEQCLVTVEAGGATRRFRFADGGRADRARFGHFSAATAATHLEATPDDFTERFLRGAIARISHHEEGEQSAEARGLWERCAALVSVEVAARLEPGSGLVVQRVA